MATVITSECINCGACEPECPNTAIYAGGVDWDLDGVKHPALAADIFYIVPDKCTECVGFFDREACAVVCPVDCCIPDPQRPETEDVLITRARQLHPDRAFPEQFPSRFRTAAAAAPLPAVPEPPPPKAPAPEPPAATPKPAPAAAAASTPAAAQKPEPKPAVPPKPAPAPEAKPAAQPKPEPAKERPAAPVAAKPAERPAAEPAQGPLPPIETFKIPIDCFRCGHEYTVPFKHFRTGVVHFCPACRGSFVVTRSVHGHVHDAAHRVHAELCREAEVSGARSAEARQALAERVRGRLEAFTDEIRQSTKQFRPPGAPRKRAGIFG